MSTAQCKIAGAPISWGVCEVPGWGYQFPADRVLNEMREIGLARPQQLQVVHRRRGHLGRRLHVLDVVRDDFRHPPAEDQDITSRRSHDSLDRFWYESKATADTRIAPTTMPCQ